MKPMNLLTLAIAVDAEGAARFWPWRGRPHWRRCRRRRALLAVTRALALAAVPRAPRTSGCGEGTGASGSLLRTPSLRKRRNREASATQWHSLWIFLPRSVLPHL